MSSYNENGDMIAEAGQTFRQVGWVIQGGVYDGRFLSKDPEELAVALSKPHGGYSPVYIEVGKD